MEDLDYLPPDARSPWEAPYGGRADSRGQWPPDQYGGRPAADYYPRGYGRQRRRPGAPRGHSSPLADSGLLAGYSPVGGPLPAYQPPPDPLSGGRHELTEAESSWRRSSTPATRWASGAG